MSKLRNGVLALALLAGMTAPALAEVQKVSLSLGADRALDKLDGEAFNGFTFEGEAWQVGYDGEASIRRSPSISSLIYNNGVFDFLGITLSGLSSHYSKPMPGQGTLTFNFYDAAHALLGSRNWTLDRTATYVSFSDSIKGVNAIEIINPRSPYYLAPRILDLSIAGAVPEPETWAMMGVGLTAMLLRVRRKKTV